MFQEELSLSACAKQLDHISLHERDDELVCEYHWKTGGDDLPTQEVFPKRDRSLEIENAALRAELERYQRLYTERFQVEEPAF